MSSFRSPLRWLTATWFVLFLCSPQNHAYAAKAVGGPAEFARVPLSVKHAGCGIITGYDGFTGFINPALIANQTNSWEAALSNQTMFGAGQNTWAVSGGWASQLSGSSSWGAALLVSGESVLDDLEEYDINGNATGTKVSAGGQQFGLAGMRQFGILGCGLAIRYARATLDGLPDKIAAQDSLLLNAGTAITLGNFDLSFAYRDMEFSSPGEGIINGGIGFRIDNSWLKCSLGTEINLPITSNGSISAGFNWNIHRYFVLRSGFVISDAPLNSIRGGFSIPVKGLTLDYAVAYKLQGELDHHIALNYSFGKERNASLQDYWNRSPSEKDNAPVVGSSAAGAKTPEIPSPMPQEPMATLKPGQVVNLAVAELKADGTSASDAAVITGLLRNALVKYNTVRVVDKSNMDRVLSEQAFQQTGCTSQECAVKLGKLLNVRCMVVGNFGKLLSSYFLNVNLVDVENGQIISAESEKVQTIEDIELAVGKLANKIATRATNWLAANQKKD
jgi:hypothetical protein